MNTLYKASLTGLLLFFCAAESMAAQRPVYPSSPHRVLRVDGDAQTYYLLEKGHSMEIEINGPSLLELSLRRVVFPGEQGVQASLVRVILDEEIQVPIAFRRAREDGVGFVDENRFAPSAARNSKIAITGGEHIVQLSVGSNTTAVAIALTEQLPENYVAQRIEDDNQLPPLEPLTSAKAKKPSPQQRPEPVVKRTTKGPAQTLRSNNSTEQAVNTPAKSPVDSPLSVPPSMPAKPDGPMEDGHAPSESASAMIGQENKTVIKTDKRVLQMGLGFGLASNFIGLGNMSPALHLGLRYPLPGLQQKLQLQINIQVNHYAIIAQQGGQTQFQLAHWIVPISVGAAYQLFNFDPWQMETGAAFGFAPNFSDAHYREKDLSCFGVGASALLWLELSWKPGFGQVFVRSQLDAISASNTLLPHAYFAGISVLTGYRVSL